MKLETLTRRIHYLPPVTEADRPMLVYLRREHLLVAIDVGDQQHMSVKFMRH